jgi:hypothetical protein
MAIGPDPQIGLACAGGNVAPAAEIIGNREGHQIALLPGLNGADEMCGSLKATPARWALRTRNLRALIRSL